MKSYVRLLIAAYHPAKKMVFQSFFDNDPALRIAMAQSRHAQRADECLLLEAKRTLTNRCLPISINEYTALYSRAAFDDFR
jgi:hypothetical protein